MFDVAPTELLLVAVVALVVIGPKDLPRAMRFVGQWVAKARGVARHFRVGIDEMIRQAELEEMEKKWAAENERIMREHPIQPAIEHQPAQPAAIDHQPTETIAPSWDSVPPAEQAPAIETDMVSISETAQASLPLDPAPATEKKPARKRAAKPKPAAPESETDA